jgi:hypothetical protein
MEMYTEKEIQEMEAALKELKKVNLKTLKGPAKDRHLNRIYILQTEIDAAKGNISSGRKARLSSLQNDNNKSIVKLRSPAGGTQSPREIMMKGDKKRSDRIGQLLKNTSGQIENLNPKKQPSVKKGKDSTQAPSRQRLEDNLLDVSDNQLLGGTKTEDAEMNALEQLVSRIVGRNVRFEDIPEDDPFIADMPQNYQNLRRGGQVKRMGHGGAITPEQKKRMTRIAKEYKALRSKKKATAPKVATSKKRSAPFSDIKKAIMNGNKKRTNR